MAGRLLSSLLVLLLSALAGAAPLREIRLPVLPELARLPVPLVGDPVFAAGVPMPLLVPHPGDIASALSAPPPEAEAPPIMQRAEAIARELGKSYGLMSELEMGQVLAEAPIDAMGADFQEAFGRLGVQLKAEPGRMKETGLAVFQARLALAKKYNTMLADMMEPGWKTGVPSARIYQERWDGAGRGFSWSFAQRATPRGRQLGEEFDGVLISGDARRINDWLVWPFEYALGKRRLSFPVFRAANGDYYLRQAGEADMPDITRRLDDLWEKVLSVEAAADDRLDALVEFEWLWYRSNPFGRAAASVGDVLSILMQKRLEAEGFALTPHAGYAHRDVAALASSLTAYRALRLRELKANFPPQTLKPL